MKEKLTGKLVSALKTTGKEYEVHDTLVVGLFVRVTATGFKSYVVRWRRASKKALGRVGILTLDQARQEATQYLYEARNHGEPLAVTQNRKGTAPPSLRDFIDDTYMPWFKTHHKGHEKTLHTLDNSFGPIMAQRIDAITGRDLEQIRTTWMQSGNKSSTANRKMGSIGGVFSRAVDWGYLSISPSEKIKPLKIDSKGAIRYLSENEMRNLLNALEVREHRAILERDSANRWRIARHKELYQDLRELAFADHLKPMIIVSLSTGMRRGEVLGLTWNSINFDRKIITVGGDITKTSETRHIPMNTETTNALRAWKDQSGQSRFVFPGLEGGRTEDVKTSWKKLLQEACISGFRWHDMRHDFASRLVTAGYPLNTVRDLLGHTDIKMTLRYAHLAPAIKARAVEALSLYPSI
ncbi:integrase [Pseudomonas simiae]|uniref:site-specific integrase n=1 Tax=Pseudomonas simiae TaxID=321846 RepID=UPI000D024F28|nr:site-specific integrase [Pseudomonas simiae]PRW84535.1 integrase [Pseudomonas simiae]